MSAVVYKITCSVNGKAYVGITVKTVEQRLAMHKVACIKGKNPNSRLYAAFEKYGAENFSVEMIQTCATLAEACEAERFWIAALGTHEDGYNATLGGEGTLGYVASASHRANLSAALKGIPRTPEWKARIGAGNRGRKLPPVTDEARANMSAVRKGRVKSEEHKQKIREAVAASWAAGRTRKSKTSKTEEVAR